jgi:hypothetical protein
MDAHDDPTFKAELARIMEGLRKAGVPEGTAKTNWAGRPQPEPMSYSWAGSTRRPKTRASAHVHGPDVNDFFFWKNSEKGGLRLRPQNRGRLQKFLGEFFFPKTSNLLRKFSARRSRDVKGWSRTSAPFAPSEIRAALSMSRPRRKPRMVAGSDPMARLPFRATEADSAKEPNQSVKRLTEG